MATGIENRVESKEEDPLAQAALWGKADQPVALAVVTKTWGSSPRPVGSIMAVRADGAFAGSVSGGCIEGAVIRECQDVLAQGKPRKLAFGVSDEEAWGVGLACGGAVELVALQTRLASKLQDARLARRPVALAQRLADGAEAMIDSQSEGAPLAAAELETARQALKADATGLDESGSLFVLPLVPTQRLLIIGAVHIAQFLAPMAAMAGYQVTVIDPRRGFATPERFPKVDLAVEWPDEALSHLGLDAGTALVALTHDPKIDDPALAEALKSDVFYIGALGSRRSHAKRLERLGGDGGRIHGPIGLDIGAEFPAEIAVSILAEIIQVKRKA
ncbi:MAG: XdhC family protein [Rhodospirillales bacterium]|nr:XdhC family protein [Rhodospirillales bacterium]